MVRLWQSELAFLLAALAAVALTPLAARLARVLGAVDLPGERRVHDAPTPRCGGLAIVVGCWIGVAAAALVDPGFLGRQTTTVGLMGLADDLRPLPATARLVIQALVALAIVWAFDVRVAVLTRFLGQDGPYIYLQWAAVPVTALWIVAITNAFNWLDGLDGLCAGIAGLTSVTLVLMAGANPLLSGSAVVAALAAAVAGASIGFLRYNLSPAQVFMGDSGAMFLGFMLACVSAVGAFKKATLGILIPPLVLTVPIYEIFSTMYVRWRTGQPLHASDRRNVHHRLMARGLSKERVVYLLYAATGLCCVIALIFVGRT
jgi:UDP-GlcNAc:undecaprenyl-phosphate GlcNAc-1-phosphate transferase